MPRASAVATIQAINQVPEFHVSSLTRCREHLSAPIRRRDPRSVDRRRRQRIHAGQGLIRQSNSIGSSTDRGRSPGAIGRMRTVFGACGAEPYPERACVYRWSALAERFGRALRVVKHSASGGRLCAAQSERETMTGRPANLGAQLRIERGAGPRDPFDVTRRSPLIAKLGQFRRARRGRPLRAWFGPDRRLGVGSRRTEPDSPRARRSTSSAHCSMGGPAAAKTFVTAEATDHRHSYSLAI